MITKGVSIHQRQPVHFLALRHGAIDSNQKFPAFPNFLFCLFAKTTHRVAGFHPRF